MDKPTTSSIRSPWKLQQAVKEYLDFIDNDEEYHEDREDKYRNAIFEQAVEAFTHEKVWDWINNRQD